MLMKTDKHNIEAVITHSIINYWKKCSEQYYIDKRYRIHYIYV